MILRQYLIHNIGKVARIGCVRGSGFIFADRVGINLPRVVIERADREVLSVSPSIYGGDIVMIDGSDTGSEWIPKALENPPSDAVPDSLYIAMADRIAGLIVEALWAEMVKTRSASYEKERENAWYAVDYYRAVILSPNFAIITPNADGSQILTLLEKRFKKTFGVDFWSDKS